MLGPDAGGTDSARSVMRRSSKIAPSPAIGGKPEEIFTARGMIIRNLKTIKTSLNVRTFLWYL